MNEKKMRPRFILTSLLIIKGVLRTSKTYHHEAVEANERRVNNLTRRRNSVRRFNSASSINSSKQRLISSTGD